MARQINETDNGSTRRSMNDQKVLTLGVLSLTLLLGIIFFGICFAVGMIVGPNLPI